MNTSPQSYKKSQIFVRWFIWILAVTFFFYEFTIRVSPSVMVNSLMAAFHTDAGKIGAISSIYYYVYAPMQLPVGLLMDRFGPRYLLPMAAIVCGGGMIIFGIAPNFEVLALGRFLSGFGTSFAFVGLLYITSHWFPHHLMALLIGISNSIAMAGAITGEGPLSIAENYLGWRSTTSILGVIGILLGFFIFIVVFFSPRRKEEKMHETISFLNAWNSLKKVLIHPRSWINAGIAIFIYATTAGFAALWGVPFLMSNHHMPREIAGFATSSIYLGWIVGGPLVGHLSDRFQKKRPFLKICSLLAGIALLPVIVMNDLSHPLIFALLILVGIFSAAELLNFTYAIDLHPYKATGSAIAFTNFIIMLGGAFFQPFVGWVLDRLWTGATLEGVQIYSQTSYTIATLCFPLSFFLAFILSFFLKEKGNHQKKVLMIF